MDCIRRTSVCYNAGSVLRKIGVLILFSHFDNIVMSADFRIGLLNIMFRKRLLNGFYSVGKIRCMMTDISVYSGLYYITAACYI